MVTQTLIRSYRKINTIKPKREAATRPDTQNYDLHKIKLELEVLTKNNVN